MRKIAQFLLQKPYQTMLVAGVLGGFAQFMFLLALPSAAAVALIRLRKGATPGFPVMLGTGMLSFALGLLISGRPGFDYPVALLLILPAYLGAKILRASESQGLAIAAITVCAMLFALAMQVLTGNAEQWWSKWLQVAVLGVPGASFDDFSGSILPFNGVIALLIGMLSSLALMWARWLQSLLFLPGGFEREFRVLSIPFWVMKWMLVALPFAALLDLRLLYDMLLIEAMLFCFQGLAVLQYSAAKQRLNTFLMSVPYVLLVILPQFFIIGFACLGATDIFLNFRKLSRIKS